MNELTRFTQARVGLGLAGDSVPLRAALDVRLAHARARDAVHFALDTRSLALEMEQLGWTPRGIHSLAKNREEYLRRPDLGRFLDDASIAAMSPCSVAIVIADGLSALAVHRHAVPLLKLVLPEFGDAPVWIAQQARVALGDHVGELTHAELSVVLIGERPGLSSPDSLGIYLTWAPTRGRTDAGRNCISNIHAQGLSYEQAAHKLMFLVGESRRRRLSGVALKEEAPISTRTNERPARPDAVSGS